MTGEKNIHYNGLPTPALPPPLLRLQWISPQLAALKGASTAAFALHGASEIKIPTSIFHL